MEWKPLEAALRAVPGVDVQIGGEEADVTFRFFKEAELPTFTPHGFTVWVKHGQTERPPSVHADHSIREGDHAIDVGPREAWIGFELPASFQDPWARNESFPRLFARLLEHVRALEPEDLACHPTGRPLLAPRPLDAPLAASPCSATPRPRSRARASSAASSAPRSSATPSASLTARRARAASTSTRGSSSRTLRRAR